jgi:hypothetical protein
MFCHFYKRKLNFFLNFSWSFGVLLHEMFTFGRNPFDGVEHKDLLEYILRNQQEGLMEKPALCPDEM